MTTRPRPTAAARSRPTRTGAPCPSNPAACEDEKAQNLANNTDTVTTNVGGAAIDLAVGDITDVTDPVATGDKVIYTMTVTNAGTQDAKAVDGNMSWSRWTCRPRA